MVVFKIKYRVFTFGKMGSSDLSLYHTLRNKSGEQETAELIEFIHSEVKADMETAKENPDIKTSVFLTKEDKIDLINRIDITKSDLIDRMDFIKIDLMDRINKVKTDLIFWIAGVSVLQYILLMITRKFF
jgi:hypothetical protein